MLEWESINHQHHIHAYCSNFSGGPGGDTAGTVHRDEWQFNKKKQTNFFTVGGHACQQYAGAN